MSKNANLGPNLVERLVPVIDRLRRLHTRFGTRPWDVTVVRRRWSGAIRGEGTPTIISELTLDPRPAVGKEDAALIVYDVRSAPGGQDPVQRFKLSEISLAYAESELTGKPLLVNEEVYYRCTDGQGTKQAPQYYTVEGEIQVDREKTIGWIIYIQRSEIQE